MTDPLVWPICVLKPLQIQLNPVPFTRSGGRTLGGVQRSTRTDRGHWSIVYRGVPLGDAARPRCWSAIRTGASGMAGRLAVPVWSFDSSPWADGVGLRRLHADDACLRHAVLGRHEVQPADHPRAARCGRRDRRHRR